MRIDKYLQVSRIIKRRSVAHEIVSKQRVKVNDKIAKPSTTVKVNDEIEIRFGNTIVNLVVNKIEDKVKKEDASTMYEIISETKGEI